ncbi:MAG TPA: response regulator [Chitinophagaceae bacterium]|nr:response regulator [Chitinophagaceae bacterium]
MYQTNRSALTSEDLPSPKAHDITALIIDDESDTRLLIGIILKQKNIQSRFAGSLKEAEKLLEGPGTPSIIFLDNHLPDGLGITYIKRLKSVYPDARLVMMTAHDNESDRKQALLAGVDYFSGKPLTTAFIYSMIKFLPGQ